MKRSYHIGSILIIFWVIIFFGLTTSWSEEEKGEVKNGRILYKKMKCSHCHIINGEGGVVGPDLTREGTKGRGIVWQIDNLTGAKTGHPTHSDAPREMPDFDKFTYKMLLDLATFLESLE